MIKYTHNKGFVYKFPVDTSLKQGFPIEKDRSQKSNNVYNGGIF